MLYFRTRLNGVPRRPETSSPLCLIPTRSDGGSHHAQRLNEFNESLSDDLAAISRTVCGQRRVDLIPG